jgi:hypothetical protein
MRSKLFALLAIIVMSCSALAVDKDAVAKAVKDDNISEQDCRKWYTVYKGAYIYVKELDAVGSKDFGDVFDKIVLVRDKTLPAKGNANFVKATDLSAYAEADFTADKRTDLAEDLYKICEGLKAGMK